MESNYEGILYKKIKKKYDDLNTEILTFESRQHELDIELKILEKAFYSTKNNSDKTFLKEANNTLKNELDKIESKLPKLQKEAAELMRRLELLKSATSSFEFEHQ